MLTFTVFSGSPYHIGLALGKAGAPAMHDLIKPLPLWSELMQWLGSDELRAMQELVQQHHPYIWDEIQGIARGLELPPDEVFLWNCQGSLPMQRADNDAQVGLNEETAATTSASPPPDPSTNAVTTPSAVSRPIGYTAVESTTILMPTSEGPRIVHHMTGDPDVADHCGIAEFVVDQGPEFAAFISPGLLPGHAVAVTNNGLCITVNTTLPHQRAARVPNIVLTRALLNMPDLSSAIQFLNDAPRSGGLHLGLAQRGGSALLGIEATAEKVSIQHAKAATLHTNHLIHESMQDVEQTVSASSRLRLDTGSAHLSQSDNPDPLLLLAELITDAQGLALSSGQPDTTINSRPMNVDDADPDNQPVDTLPARTLITAFLNINADAVDWDVYENIDDPARFRLRDAKHI